MTNPDSTFAGEKKRRSMVTYWMAIVCAGLFLVLSQADFHPAQASTLSDAAPSAALSVMDYGAKGDGLSNDTAAIQACLEAAAGQGKTCYLPAGTYRAYALSPPSGVVMRGAGPSSTTIQTLYGTGAAGDGLDLLNRSGVTIADLRLIGSSTGQMQSNDQAIYLGNSRNCTIENVTFNYWSFAVRLSSDGSVRGNSAIAITGCRTLAGSHTGVFGGYTSGLTISGCDFDSYTGDPGGTSHQFYFLIETSGVTVENTVIRNGSNYSVQIYPNSGLRNMTFRNVTFRNVRAGVIVSPGSEMLFDGVTASSTRYESGHPWFNLSGSNITVQNFNISDASMLTSASGSNIVFRNGTYTGSNLGSGASFTEVNSSYTPTTLPVTTTTLPVTATTLPVTTTTLPVTTTTLPVTTTTLPVTTITRPVTTTALPATTTTRSSATTTTAAVPRTTTQPAPTTTLPVTRTTSPGTTVPPVTTTTSTPSDLTHGVQAAVTMASPQDKSTVRGRVDVRVTVSSPYAVSKVRLYVDGRLISQDSRAPYSLTWRSDAAAPGSVHTITAAAYNRINGELGRASCEVTVAPPISAFNATAEARADEVVATPNGGRDYSAAISALVEAGIMSGYKDGQFGAEQPATRAQFAKMLALTLGIADDDLVATPFTDLDPIDEDLYPHKYIAALYASGAIAGTTADQFSPWMPVTRAQVATMLIRALEGLAPEAMVIPAMGSLPATGDISGDHTQCMAVAEASGLLQGIVDYGPTWDPWIPASRGELAQVLMNTLDLD